MFLLPPQFLNGFSGSSPKQLINVGLGRLAILYLVGPPFSTLFSIVLVSGLLNGVRGVFTV